MGVSYPVHVVYSIYGTVGTYVSRPRRSITKDWILLRMPSYRLTVTVQTPVLSQTRSKKRDKVESL